MHVCPPTPHLIKLIPNWYRNLHNVKNTRKVHGEKKIL